MGRKTSFIDDEHTRILWHEKSHFAVEALNLDEAYLQLKNLLGEIVVVYVFIHQF